MSHERIAKMESKPRLGIIARHQAGNAEAMPAVETPLETNVSRLASHSRLLMTKAASALAIAILLLALCPGGSSTVSTPDQIYTFNYENVLGTSLEMKVLAPSAAQSEKAGAAALAEIDREAKILSSWDSTSEFSRWFQTMNQPVHISPELFEVFGLFDHWRDQTHGALDASAETITRAWQTAAAEQRLPSQAELNAAVARAQRVHWKLDAASRTATHTSDAPLAMNSFVKSYIVGRSADAALAVAGVRGVVVNIGGDLVVRGTWNEPVDIADPQSDAENSDPIAHLMVHDRAVATSGDYRRGVEIGGQHYSHIVDPRTGMPADDIISSTVVAPNPADAGALATAFSVLTPAESARVASTIPDAEYLLVKKSGALVTSKGWSSLEAPPAPAAASVRFVPTFQTVSAQAQSTSRTWNPEYQLDIGVELARIEGDRVTRPFLVIWIEDLDGTPRAHARPLVCEVSVIWNELRVWSNDTGLLATTARA